MSVGAYFGLGLADLGLLLGWVAPAALVSADVAERVAPPQGSVRVASRSPVAVPSMTAGRDGAALTRGEGAEAALPESTEERQAAEASRAPGLASAVAQARDADSMGDTGAMRDTGATGASADEHGAGQAGQATDVEANEPAPGPKDASMSGSEWVMGFNTSKALLSADDAARLSEFAGKLESGPSCRIYIDGHSDERGPQRYNEILSRQRAEVVAGVLRSRGFTKHITVRAFGSRWPIAHGAHGQNRRVRVLAQGCDT